MIATLGLVVPRTLRQSSWIQRFFLLVIGCTIALILAGIFIVPSTLTSLAGVWAILGDILMQLALATLALFGPWSFQRYRQSIQISLAFGLLFALLYDGVIFGDFAGVYVDTNIYALFIGAAFLAGGIATYQTRQLRRGVIVATWALVIGTAVWSVGILSINYATWGSHQQYQFWLNDGAIDDFHHSGSADLNAFLLQDLQGALFFHPLLSMVLGAVSGLVGSRAAQGIVLLQQALLQRARKKGEPLFKEEEGHHA
jgi:hypothetical protein